MIEKLKGWAAALVAALMGLAYLFFLNKKNDSLEAEIESLKAGERQKELDNEIRDASNASDAAIAEYESSRDSYLQASASEGGQSASDAKGGDKQAEPSANGDKG